MSADGSSGRSRYDGLSHAQLVELLEQRDRQKKLGLIWERDEIEADRALQAEFVAADLLCDRSDPANGAGGWPNLVIEGDNYDALRWLRMTLAGRVKCIYVDPPYNTGARDWVYNDHYVSKEDRWRHSTWLEFLYRRFALARDLLTEDGVILVSINDENRAKLELMLDEVLPGMRVGSLVWRNRTGSNSEQVAFLSPDHEHVLIYAASGFRFGGSEKSYSGYANPDDDPEAIGRRIISRSASAHVRGRTSSIHFMTRTQMFGILVIQRAFGGTQLKRACELGKSCKLDPWRTLLPMAKSSSPVSRGLAFGIRESNSSLLFEIVTYRFAAASQHCQRIRPIWTAGSAGA